LVELGEILMTPSLGRTSDDQITVCDLTGIAIQDLQIAQTVFEATLASS
jgi:ornithine cyclodeaminase